MNTATVLVSVVISLIAGVVSSYLTHAIVERSDKKKWKHVKNELLDSQRYLCNQILTSIRLFFNINIPSGYIKNEESVFEFLKTEMVENVENYQNKIKFPNKDLTDNLIKNLSGLFNELVLQRDRFLLFRHSKPDYYQDCSFITNAISKTLMPLRTFPELVNRNHDSDQHLVFWRDVLFDEIKNLMDLVYEARVRTINERK
jgi:hypothetical protein